MSNNPFVLNKNEYQRDINVLKHYVQDSARYLSQMTGKPYEECITFVKKSVKPGGEFGFVDPTIEYLERGDNGDRVKKVGTLHNYLMDSIKTKELIAPTLTTYLSPTVKKSLLVDFIDGNVKARGVAKKAMFAAKADKNVTLEAIKDREQTNKKLSNNALSGAHVSASTPLYNKTAHSTLTSTCRSTSGYGNANNEKFLCGNRHYWSPDIVRNNVISIINNSNYPAIESAMAKYGIRHPTALEVIAAIKYSTDLYWKAKFDFNQIETLIYSLSDIQRSAFLYTGDFYHLMKCNEVVARTFIDKLSSRINLVHPNPKTIIDAVSDDIRNFSFQLCEHEMRGKTIYDIAGTPAYGIVASTIENIQNTLAEYTDFIRAFWVTINVPASVAVFPDSIRRSAVTSDTDSTIFTVQDWVIWHKGKNGFDSASNAVAYTLVFLAAQAITHVLARMSANFGIEEKRIHQIAMKSEYFFPVFIPTQAAKHYYALISCREGAIYAEYDQEIKGVHLKSSNAPKIVMAEAKRMMEFIMHSVIDDKPISINYILKWIGDIERDVINSISKGSFEYFRKGQIKLADSYTRSAEESPYLQYLLWEEVFSPKYGNSQPPPYMCVKVSTELNKPGNVKEWIANMKDRELATRLENWMIKYNRKHLGSAFMLPEQCITHGIPTEILDIVGVRKIVLNCTGVFYILLETLGIFMLNKKSTRLVHDHH